jgi:hypothetical protein
MACALADLRADFCFHSVFAKNMCNTGADERQGKKLQFSRKICITVVFQICENRKRLGDFRDDLNKLRRTHANKIL